MGAAAQGMAYAAESGEQADAWPGRLQTSTFAGLRGLTHWIRAGHGPAGGVSVWAAGTFITTTCIALPATVGAVGLRGTERPALPCGAIASGQRHALIVDELPSLLDLRVIYWAADGRASVDAAASHRGRRTSRRYADGRMCSMRCETAGGRSSLRDRHPHPVADLGSVRRGSPNSKLVARISPAIRSRWVARPVGPLGRAPTSPR